MPLNGLIKVVLAVVVSSPVVSMAEVYRWVDENGKVHFGDRPPRGVQTESLDLPETGGGPPAPTDEERKAKTRRLLDAWEEERRIKKEQQAQAAADKAKRKRRCSRARHELRDLQQGALFYELDEQGERRYLSDAELEQEKQKWREAIEYWCK